MCCLWAVTGFVTVRFLRSDDLLRFFDSTTGSFQQASRRLVDLFFFGNITVLFRLYVNNRSKSFGCLDEISMSFLKFGPVLVFSQDGLLDGL